MIVELDFLLLLVFFVLLTFVLQLLVGNGRRLMRHLGEILAFPQQPLHALHLLKAVPHGKLKCMVVTQVLGKIDALPDSFLQKNR